MRDYLSAGGRESEQAQRHRDLVAKFRETLALAVPLISVDEQTVQLLHGGRSVEYRYKFSVGPVPQPGHHRRPRAGPDRQPEHRRVEPETTSSGR